MMEVMVKAKKRPLKSATSDKVPYQRKRSGVNWTPRTRRNFISGIGFSSLWIIGFLAFTIYPMAASLYYSFTEYHTKKPKVWVGLDNYLQLFKDPLFYKALVNTSYLVVVGISLTLVISFTCAVLLNFKVRGQSFYRVIYFLPSIVPTVAATLLFIWVLNPNQGYLHILLGKIGILGPDWFKDPNWSKPGLILLSLWGMGQTIMIYLSGLQDIPTSLLEAAEIDGANWFQRMRYVTIPLLAPLTVFLLIMGVIGMFQYFSQAYVFANAGAMGGALGSPLQSTLFYSLYLYQVGFMQLNMGYASAMAWVLFMIILACTWLMLRYSSSRVYYAG
jgi:multiple sugar transport system permease protein